MHFENKKGPVFWIIIDHFWDMKAPNINRMKIKNPHSDKLHGFFRGPERIRTAVQGFADLCLATRPQDHFWSMQKYSFS
jgi:hypothetical protein